MTSKQESWYQSTLAKMQSGSWNALKAFTWCCASLGVDPETAVADARALGVRDRDADIRRGIRTAIAKGAGDGRRAGNVRRHRKPEPERPSPYAHLVRDFIAAGGGTATERDLAALSPCDFSRMDYRSQLLAFLALWQPTDLLFVTFKGPNNGVLGERGNIRTAQDWARHVERGGELPGDLITPNPLTGLPSPSNPRSLIMADCVKRYPHIVLELDERPIPQQLAFWRGFIQDPTWSKRLVSLVHSAGRSVHGLLRVNAPDILAREAIVKEVKYRFASDPETKVVTEDGKPRLNYPFRVDEQAMAPLVKTRLPGVLRKWTDRVQRLLYWNPSARNVKGWS